MSHISPTKVVSTGRADSTPLRNSDPAHAVGNELETALNLLHMEAGAFAQSIIKDPVARADYMRKTKAASDELVELVKQRKLTPHEGARAANAMRNQILELTRARLSDFGLSISEEIKRTGPPLRYFEERYAIKRYARSFSTLTQVERDSVWLDIVHAAGRSNPRVNLSVRWYGIAGRTLLIASLALAIYSVAEANDKPREVAKQGAIFGAGAAGGILAGAAVVTLASNPAGWVVGVTIFVGGALTGLGTSEFFDYFWPER